MSLHRANSADMASNTAGSACAMPSSVSSENTTPKPNASSRALRSQTVISHSGESCWASAAKYNPPGPPPMTATRTVFLLVVPETEYVVDLASVKNSTHSVWCVWRVASDHAKSSGACGPAFVRTSRTSSGQAVDPVAREAEWAMTMRPVAAGSSPSPRTVKA